ncbi:MAG: hypothetical protein A3K68_01365 [Euryarchaeota archaeon RBG_16_68_13]|nr:MAG: hypothetical protein A3K68_01365 [Euryarchaeota archaeon RBG_16_68_13]
MRITPETLKTFAARGTLREWPGGLVVLSEVTEAFRQEILEIFPLLGEPAEILSAGPRIAAALGRERLEIFLPRDAALLEAAEAAGFEPMAWGREAILSEKPVRA